MVFYGLFDRGFETFFSECKKKKKICKKVKRQLSEANKKSVKVKDK